MSTFDAPPPDCSGNNNDANLGSRTSNWIIQCAGIFSSEINGFEDAATCYRVNRGIVRKATVNSNGQQFGDGQIVVRNIEVWMPYSNWGPLIQQHLYEGKKIDKIVIIRLININGTNVVIQELTCEVCMFVQYDQNNDLIWFAFCSAKITDLNKAFDHDGNPVGNIGTIYDGRSAKVEALSG
jgi:hypothetical protein